MVLTDEGYAVLEASDGVECIDTLLLNPERMIVLLDLMMPRMTGLDVLMFVVSDATIMLQHVYIVMTANIEVVAHAGPHLSTLLHRLNIPVVGKPFDIDELLECVAQAAHRLMPIIRRDPSAGAK